MLGVIGDLARGKLADRVEEDTAPLLGTPDEMIARLKELEAGGADEHPAGRSQRLARQPARLRPRGDAAPSAVTRAAAE